MVQLKAADFLMGLFGYSRVRYPQERMTINAIVSSLRDCGAVKVGEGGMPTAFDLYYFQIKRRQVKLCVEDYGDVTLSGPKRLVEDLSRRIADKLSAVRPKQARENL